MKTKLLSISLILLICGSVAACQNPTLGAVGGAAAGGVLGSAVSGGNTTATILGAVAGGAVGAAASTKK